MSAPSQITALSALQLPDSFQPMMVMAKKSFPFPVWSGLLTAEHRGKMGSSVWTFLWFLDRVTREKDGWGVVLGGKPVKYKEIASSFGVHPSVIREDRKTLLDQGYIDAVRTPYGYRYRVRNSRKFGIWGSKRSTENGTSHRREVPKSVDPDMPNSVDTKKTMQLDHAVTPTPTGKGFEEFWKIYPKKQAKAEAMRAWSKVAASEVPSILASVEAWKRADQWKRDSGQYVPNPATFLNGRRWEDEISPAATVPGQSTMPTPDSIRPRGR